MAEGKNCFVIAPIGESDSDTRKRSDQVLKHVIMPAVASLGYEAVRADQIEKPGIITSQVIQHIINDSLVIADLTEYNPNVFYELAIRHALRKPFIHLIQEGERIPFDVANTRTVHVNHHDLDSVDSAKNEIINQIKSLEEDASNIETPFSVSLDLQALRQSEKPEERSLADLVAVVSDINTGLGKLEMKIDASSAALQRRVDDLDTPKRSSHKEARIRRFMLRDIGQMGLAPEMRLLISTSFFRDSLPWLYELGVEIYRSVRNGDPKIILNTIKEFQQIRYFLMMEDSLDISIDQISDIMILIEEINQIAENSMPSGRRRRSVSP